MVDNNDVLQTDVFVAAVSRFDLTEEEVDELVKFIKLGGVVYISGHGGTGTHHTGVEYNSLFSELGFGDYFVMDYTYPGAYVESSEPGFQSVLTDGPFGAVGPLLFNTYRNFVSDEMMGLVKDVDNDRYVLFEKRIGKGYLVVSSTTMYSNSLYQRGLDNRKYFLNLIALGCGKVREIPEVLLDVPSLKQGLTPYDGDDPAWEGDIYDYGDSQVLSCGTAYNHTIADCGCAMTSATMAMRYFGVKKDPLGNPVDPGSVNDYFNDDPHQTLCLNEENKAEVCYMTDGYNGGNFDWWFVEDYTKASKMYGDPEQLILVMGRREDYSLQGVKDLLESGIPVIVKVRNAGGFPHWVVVKGYIGDKLIINDPARIDPIYGDFVTMAELGYVPYATNSVVWYGVAEGYEVLNIFFRVGGRHKLLVSDSEGRRTGYDKVSGNFVEEIPGSYSTFNQGYGSANTDDFGEQVVVIESNGAEPFKVEVIGESFIEGVEMRIDADRRDGTRVSRFVQIAPEVSVSYDPDSEEVISLKTEVVIDLRPKMDKNLVNVAAAGQIVPVAVFGEEDFDVSKINFGSVKFGGALALEQFNKMKRLDLRDESGDGIMDRIFYFRAGEVEIGETGEVCLEGELLSGREFGGCNFVREVPERFGEQSLTGVWGND